MNHYITSYYYSINTTLQLISITSSFNHGVIVSNNNIHIYHWRLVLLIIHITSRRYGPVCVTKSRAKEENGFPTALCRDIACNRVHARACLSRLPARFSRSFEPWLKYTYWQSRAFDGNAGNQSEILRCCGIRCCKPPRLTCCCYPRQTTHR